MIYNTLHIRAEERARRREVLHWLLYVSGGVVLALLPLLIIMEGGITPALVVPLLELVGLLLALAVAGGLTRAGMLEPATHLLFGALIATALATALNSGGIRGAAVPALFIPIVGATVLLQPRWSFGYAVLALLSFMMLYIFGPIPERKTLFANIL